MGYFNTGANVEQKYEPENDKQANPHPLISSLKSILSLNVIYVQVLLHEPKTTVK